MSKENEVKNAEATAKSVEGIAVNLAEAKSKYSEEELRRAEKELTETKGDLAPVALFFDKDEKRRQLETKVQEIRDREARKSAELPIATPAEEAGQPIESLPERSPEIRERETRRSASQKYATEQLELAVERGDLYDWMKVDDDAEAPKRVAHIDGEKRRLKKEDVEVINKTGDEFNRRRDAIDTLLANKRYKRHKGEIPDEPFVPALVLKDLLKLKEEIGEGKIEMKIGGRGTLQVVVDGHTFSQIINNKEKKGESLDEPLDRDAVAGSRADKIVSFVKRYKLGKESFSLVVINEENKGVTKNTEEEPGKFTVEQLVDHEEFHAYWDMLEAGDGKRRDMADMKLLETAGAKENFDDFFKRIKAHILYKAQNEILASAYSRPLDRISEKFDSELYNYISNLEEKLGYVDQKKPGRTPKTGIKAKAFEALEAFKRGGEYRGIIAKAVEAFRNLASVGNYGAENVGRDAEKEKKRRHMAVMILTNKYISLDKWPEEVDKMLEYKTFNAREEIKNGEKYDTDSLDAALKEKADPKYDGKGWEWTGAAVEKRDYLRRQIMYAERMLSEGGEQLLADERREWEIRLAELNHKLDYLVTLCALDEKAGKNEEIDERAKTLREEMEQRSGESDKEFSDRVNDAARVELISKITAEGIAKEVRREKVERGREDVLQKVRDLKRFCGEHVDRYQKAEAGGIKVKMKNTGKLASEYFATMLDGYKYVEQNVSEKQNFNPEKEMKSVADYLAICEKSAKNIDDAIQRAEDKRELDITKKEMVTEKRDKIRDEEGEKLIGEIISGSYTKYARRKKEEGADVQESERAREFLYRILDDADKVLDGTGIILSDYAVLGLIKDGYDMESIKIIDKQRGFWGRMLNRGNPEKKIFLHNKKGSFDSKIPIDYFGTMVKEAEKRMKNEVEDRTDKRMREDAEKAVARKEKRRAA